MFQPDHSGGLPSQQAADGQAAPLDVAAAVSAPFAMEGGGSTPCNTPAVTGDAVGFGLHRQPPNPGDAGGVAPAVNAVMQIQADRDKQAAAGAAAAAAAAERQRADREAASRAFAAAEEAERVEKERIAAEHAAAAVELQRVADDEAAHQVAAAQEEVCARPPAPCKPPRPLQCKPFLSF